MRHACPPEWVPTAVGYGVPDPRTGDEVMASLLLSPGGELAPADLERFLNGQPDLGTKWRPRLVRLVAHLPVTGTGKLDKQRLRRQAWSGDDPLLVDDGGGYRPFTGTCCAGVWTELTATSHAISHG
ncbi:MAG: AMP-binding enzyme [Marmoricola sp.]